MAEPVTPYPKQISILRKALREWKNASRTKNQKIETLQRENEHLKEVIADKKPLLICSDLSKAVLEKRMEHYKLESIQRGEKISNLWEEKDQLQAKCERMEAVLTAIHQIVRIENMPDDAKVSALKVVTKSTELTSHIQQSDNNET